ncbi:MAG: ATP-binding protein, partial [Actinomycetota bacterium]|nr:ATP-binding protein [Actinomycetota bacterium]
TEAILDRPRQDLLGKNMWEEFPEAVGSGFEDAYRRALEGQVGVRFEERYEPLGRILEIRVYPIPDGLAVYFSDVTGDRMRDAKQRQTQRLEVLGQVTAGVAHDFNNLLAAIAGFAEMGKVDFADPEKAGLYFHQIASASKKATALTRQLLSFAREQALAPTLFDLNEAVEELSPLLIQLLPSSIALLLELAPDPVVVYADRSEVEQAVINLVVNGRDAIYGPGAVTIATTSDPSAVRLDSDAQGGAGHGGWLQVADTGSGIPDHVLPFIFDPYFSTKSAEMGTGLGLATIYGIVSQSGGSIHVDSTVGVGTAMTVALPGGPPAPPSP